MEKGLIHTIIVETHHYLLDHLFHVYWQSKENAEKGTTNYIQIFSSTN